MSPPTSKKAASIFLLLFDLDFYSGLLLMKRGLPCDPSLFDQRHIRFTIQEEENGKQGSLSRVGIRRAFHHLREDIWFSSCRFMVLYRAQTPMSSICPFFVPFYYVH